MNIRPVVFGALILLFAVFIGLGAKYVIDSYVGVIVERLNTVPTIHHYYPEEANTVKQASIVYYL